MVCKVGGIQFLKGWQHFPRDSFAHFAEIQAPMLSANPFLFTQVWPYEKPLCHWGCARELLH